MRIGKTVASQGLRHSAGALVFPGLLAAAALVQGFYPEWALPLGLVFFILGFPHGAGDEQAGRFIAYSAGRSGAYVLVAASIGALYIVQPLAGLTFFFGLSVWHFAREGEFAGTAGSWAIALLGVGGSMLFQPQMTAAILSSAIGAPIPHPFAALLAILGATGLLLAIAALVRAEARGSEAILTAIAVAFLNPVLAVGLIFLTTHAWPVQWSQITRYGARTVLNAVGLTSIAAAIGASVLVWAVVQGILAISMAAAIAFALAMPHMLTERLDR